MGLRCLLSWLPLLRVLSSCCVLHPTVINPLEVVCSTQLSPLSLGTSAHPNPPSPPVPSVCEYRNAKTTAVSSPETGLNVGLLSCIFILNHLINKFILNYFDFEDINTISFISFTLGP